MKKILVITGMLLIAFSSISHLVLLSETQKKSKNNMRKLFTVIGVLLISIGSFGQTLTLSECQQKARENHPLLKQAGVINELYSLRVKSVGSSNLPQIDLNAKASYQSDVTSISIPMLGIENEQSKDQYKVYLDIKQKIYDFGVTSGRKDVEKADYEINQQQNEVDLYKIKETVNSLFFNIMALQENNFILNLKRQSLNERMKIVESAVKNGMSLPNEFDNLKAESLTTDQQQMELLMSKQTALSLLGILIGTELNENTVLEKPLVENISESDSLFRPEEKLFDAQIIKLEQQRKTLGRTNLPMLYAFGQAGYGRPGLNMLNNDFADWYIGGVGLSWNLWDGNKTKRDKAVLQTQKRSINIARENFERNINIALKQEKDNERKLENLLTIDRELVLIKENIAKRSASGLDNGVITSADYIRDLNSALQAKAAKNIHQLKLIQSKVNYQTILGK